MANDWTIGAVHPVYGKVAAMGCKNGEAWRMFVDKHGTVSLIPLPCLQVEEDDGDKNTQ